MNNKLSKIAEIVHQYLPDSYTAAVIVAAGASTRMEGLNKQLYNLCGKPVLAHTLLSYQSCPLIHEIVVVTRPEDFEAVAEMKKTYGITKLTQLAAGGATRQESVKKGIAKLGAKVKYVAIADGARCLTTPAQITKVCIQAYSHKAACAAHLISDTVKRASILGTVTESVDRTGLWQVQTPQVFHTALYHAALIKAEKDKLSVTDDSSLIEHLGYQVRLVECGQSNIKITTPEDLPLATAVLNYRKAKK